MDVPSSNNTAQGEPAGNTVLQALILLFGVFACSTAVILIKASESHPIVLAAMRLLIASVVLTPLFIYHLKKEGAEYHFCHFKRSLIPAFLLATHFISWALGARMTYAANASLIVNMVPLVMPFILFVLLNEQVRRREIIATGWALAGIALIAIKDYQLDPQLLYGDFVCFGSMILFALYLALGRRNRDFKNLWLYLVPLYWLAGLMCLLTALVLQLPLVGYSGREYLLLTALALVPTILGHSILNHSLKHFRGQVVSIVNVLQFVFAAIMAYLIFAESPHIVFYLAALLVGIGAWVVLPRRKTRTHKTAESHR